MYGIRTENHAWQSQLFIVTPPYSFWLHKGVHNTALTDSVLSFSQLLFAIVAFLP